MSYQFLPSYIEHRVLSEHASVIGIPSTNETTFRVSKYLLDVLTVKGWKPRIRGKYSGDVEYESRNVWITADTPGHEGIKELERYHSVVPSSPKAPRTAVTFLVGACKVVAVPYGSTLELAHCSF